MYASSKTALRSRTFIEKLTEIARSKPKSRTRQRWQLIREHLAETQETAHMRDDRVEPDQNQASTPASGRPLEAL